MRLFDEVEDKKDRGYVLNEIIIDLLAETDYLSPDIIITELAGIYEVERETIVDCLLEYNSPFV